MSGSQLAAPFNDVVVGLGSASPSGRLCCAGGGSSQTSCPPHPRVGGMEEHPLDSIAPRQGLISHPPATFPTVPNVSPVPSCHRGRICCPWVGDRHPKAEE